MKVLLKRVGEPLEVVDTSEKYVADCAKTFLGNDVTLERVYLEGMDFLMVVDEDGSLKQLPTNFFLKFHNLKFPVQPIVGDVVFIRCEYVNPQEKEVDDFEVLDVTEQDIEKIKNLLEAQNQSDLLIDFARRVCLAK